MTHAAVTGHSAVMTMPYCPLPTQALVDSLSSAVDCVSNRAALRLFILCDFLFYPSFYVCKQFIIIIDEHQTALPYCPRWPRSTLPRTIGIVL
jgi:hypothetical protein